MSNIYDMDVVPVEPEPEEEPEGDEAKGKTLGGYPVAPKGTLKEEIDTKNLPKSRIRDKPKES